MVIAPVLWSTAGVVTRHIERAQPTEQVSRSGPGSRGRASPDPDLRALRDFVIVFTSTETDLSQRQAATMTTESKPGTRTGATPLLGAVAAGAVAGMYFRGLFQGYRVIWASTFITDLQSVSTFIAVVFGPSLWLSNFLGLGLESEISVARLLTVAGDDADACRRADAGQVQPEGQRRVDEQLVGQPRQPAPRPSCDN